MSLKPLRLLFVSAYPASPPQWGGQRRLEGLMKELAQRNEVSAAALYNPELDPEPSDRAMREYCREVVLVPARREGLGKRVAQVRSLFSRESFETGYFALPALQHALDRILSRRDFDVVILAAALCLSRYRLDGARGKAGPPVLLDEQ